MYIRNGFLELLLWKTKRRMINVYFTFLIYFFITNHLLFVWTILSSTPCIMYSTFMLTDIHRCSYFASFFNPRNHSVVLVSWTCGIVEDIPISCNTTISFASSLPVDRSIASVPALRHDWNCMKVHFYLCNAPAKAEWNRILDSNAIPCIR